MTTTPWDSSWTGHAAARERFFAGLAARDRAPDAPSADSTDAPPTADDEAASAPPRLRESAAQEPARRGA